MSINPCEISNKNPLNESVGSFNEGTSLTQRISTIWQRFTTSELIKNCAIRNPFQTIFAHGNNYVETMWSNDYFIGCKKNLEIAKKNLKLSCTNIKNGSHIEGCKQLLSAVTALMVLGLNVELGNFLKGALGVLISSGKLIVHGAVFTAKTILAMVMTIFLFPAVFCNEKMKEFFMQNCKEIKDSLLNIFKDLGSIITCVGHAIPSWLPAALLLTCPPAGVALLIIKQATKFTGIFDLMGYGGTAILLKIQQLNASEKDKAEIDAKWEELKKTLNPFGSYEGATIGAFGVHVAATALTTLGGIALSHFGINVSASTLSDSADAITAVALGIFGYGAHKNQKEEPIPWYASEGLLQA